MLALKYVAVVVVVGTTQFTAGYVLGQLVPVVVVTPLPARIPVTKKGGLLHLPDPVYPNKYLEFHDWRS